jgi:porin
MHKLLLRTALVAALSLSAAQTAVAGDAPDMSSYLTGDWGGRRTALVEKGIDIQAAYTVDYFSNISGGIDEGSDYIDNTDLSVALDGEKIWGVHGLSMFLLAIANTGDEFNTKRVGSNEGISSIETGDPTVKIFEAWVEQAFWGDRASVRGGLYDVNSEFNVTDSSGLFVNPTFGMETTLAATGENGVSTFPTTALGLRLNVAPTENTYIRLAMMDGVPGDPDNPDGTQIEFGDNDGTFWILEGGFGNVESGRIALGGWHYTADADDLDGTGTSNNDGYYAMAEKTIWQPHEGSNVDGFIRVALGNEDVNQFDWSASTGVTYSAPFANRPDDAAGLAIHTAHNGDPARDADDLSSSEWGVEATYSQAHIN